MNKIQSEEERIFIRYASSISKCSRQRYENWSI